MGIEKERKMRLSLLMFVACFAHEQALYETLIRQDELLAYIDRQQAAKFCVSYGAVSVFLRIGQF
jgi:hypothetical protein